MISFLDTRLPFPTEFPVKRFSPDLIEGAEGGFNKPRNRGIPKLTDALVAVEFGAARSEDLWNIVNNNINYLETMSKAQVARGGIDLYMKMGIHAWDVAAEYIIVREAGGTVIDPNGNDFRLMNRRILATSSIEIVEEVYPKFEQYYSEHD
ncbi:inositol monophosphatase 1-like [Aphis craccivora]|uniref:Inositol monophosphatase 1-like n=1 Tax=Aphis craccivora TaxID=307492 RepID=A0A6G0ZMP0_APHCR|nr:inositol monophosphatase 1-like [Aphis craccivora]